MNGYWRVTSQERSKRYSFVSKCYFFSWHPKSYRVHNLRRASPSGQVAKIATKELITFYKTCIRPVSEYACQVYHNSLPKYLSDDLERLQKRALRIILPEKTYAAALEMESTGLATMHDRRQTLTERLFSDIVSNKDHALHSLLPKVNCARPLRSNRSFNVLICKTNRFKNSFIMCNSSKCFESK